MCSLYSSSAMSLTRTCSRTMTRSLARSSSVSLVLPLAPQGQSLVCALRRAQSEIPAIECTLGFSLGDPLKVNGSCYQQSLLPLRDRDVELESYRSNYSSCDSSLADYLDFSLVEEPQRVSKDVLRSLSTSFRWLEMPFEESELFQPCEEPELSANGVESNVASVFEPASRSSLGNGMSSSGKSVTRSFKWLEVPFYESELPTSNDVVDKKSMCEPVREPVVRRSVRREVMNHVYMHDCRTGKNVENHAEVKGAMDSLGHWTMQAPRNCCLSYRHDSSGEVATLPWPDMDAGGPDEIEEFVRLVNRVEERLVFFPRYGR